MKIALVHDRIFPGGALQVFEDLIEEERRLFPNADFRIFTMIMHDAKDSTSDAKPRGKELLGIDVVEALPKWMSRVFTHVLDYRTLIVCYPLIMKVLSRKIKKWQPDTMLISSFAIAKNVRFQSKKHVSTTLYLHSPMQYIWSHKEEYLGKFSGWRKRLFAFLVPRLQQRDLQYISFDRVIFNSMYTQQLAQDLYGMQGKVQYPKLRTVFLKTKISPSPKEYFVCVGRLVKFVRECDVIIKAFNKLNLPLLMIGDGPDAAYLKSLAGDTVIFLGNLGAEELVNVVKNARGLVNLTKESFGIGTAEALCLGVPVIGFAEGGSKELVGKESGILVHDKHVSTLINAVHTFETTTWDRNQISSLMRKKMTDSASQF